MTTQEITKLLLSLWTSTKTVERLPVVREFSPYQVCTLVHTVPSRFYEGI